MTQRTATSTNKAIGGFLAAAMASGVFITSALGSAPDANATCASFFGIGNGGGCTSSQTSIAIAIGTGATATADGLFGSAFAVGNNSIAHIFSGSFFDSASAFGDATKSFAYGGVGLAMALGTGSWALAGTRGAGAFPGFENPIGNLAINVSNNPTGANSVALALGNGNLGVNLGGVTSAGEAIGTLSAGVNLFGTANQAMAADTTGLSNSSGSSVADFAFTAFGSGSVVGAGPGPFAIAGSIFQTGAHLTKAGPGFNINGIKVGGAAAPSAAARATTTTTTTTKPAAALAGSKKRTGSAAAAKHVGKK
jgi:hypothetical protein